MKFGRHGTTTSKAGLPTTFNLSTVVPNQSVATLYLALAHHIFKYLEVIFFVL